MLTEMFLKDTVISEERAGKACMGVDQTRARFELLMIEMRIV